MNTFGANIDQRIGLGVSQFNTLSEGIFRNLHVCLPAIIQSFDVEKQVVSVRISLTQSVVINGQEQSISYPVLQNIPIVMPRAGAFVLTMPVQQGDECILFFADCAIDTWQNSGQSDNLLISDRKHNLSDAFAVLGAWSQPRVLQNYSTSSAQLRSVDGNTVVDVANGTITIKANSVNVQAQTANIQASNSATVKANGTLTLEGDGGVAIKANQNLTIDGKPYLTHIHTAVQSGPATSGPVAP